MQEITGSVAGIVFRNDQNGYTVGRIETDDDLVTFTGVFESIKEGDYLSLTGDWVEHPSYGRQFKMESYTYAVPATEQAVFSYLSSGVLPGIGEKTAEAMIERFGTDVLEIIEKEPNRLLEIRGIGKKTLANLVEAYREQNETRRTMLALQEYGISASAALRLYRVYGEKTVSKLFEDPYQVVFEVPGFGFKRAEQLAEKLGVEKSDPRRIRAGLQWILRDCSRSGNTYLEEEDFVGKTAETLEVDREAAHEAIDQAAVLGEVRSETIGDEEEGEETQRIYYPEDLYQAEDSAALAVARMATTQSRLDIDNIDRQIGRIEKDLNLKLDPSQAEAIRAAAESSLSIITGGPGTGKTTIIHGILMLYETLGLNAKLAAPTGRAAKRMSETTGYEASTIHRLLEYDPNISGFTRDEDNPIEADAIIVDESSMIDIELFAALLAAVDTGTRIVFVGDADQLPSVGPGNVLNDLIRSGAAKTAFLHTIHRQKEGSVISSHAHEIIEGNVPQIDNQSDFMLIGKHDEDVALATIEEVVGERIEKSFHFNPFSDVQVLAPFRRGKLGVENLNLRLQERLNPPAPYKAEIRFGEGLFREGDKVMQIQNNYKMVWEDAERSGEGVFNGDIGIITTIEDGEVHVQFSDDKCAVYDRDSLGQLTLAYCSTIHKAQGSEFPAVVIALSGGMSPFLNRRLLYTAVTRAKKKLILIGRREIFSHMIKNNNDARRTSRLCERIREYQKLGI